MPETLLEIAKIAATLVAGAGGTALFTALFVRPRVSYGMRIERSVRIMNELDRARIEAALNAHRVPTGYCEVEWWNHGRRAARDIDVEICLGAPILSWEAASPPSDLAKPWKCTADPTDPANDSRVLRISQPKLMPTERNRFVIAFAYGPDAPDAVVRAFLADRAIKEQKAMSAPVGLLFATILFAPASLLAWGMLEWATTWPVMKGDADTSRSLFRALAALLTLGAWFAGMFVTGRLLDRVEYSAPSWKQVSNSHTAGR